MLKPNKSGTYETIDEYKQALEAVQVIIKRTQAQVKWFNKQHGSKPKIIKINRTTITIECETDMASHAHLAACYAMDLERAVRPPAKEEP